MLRFFNTLTRKLEEFKPLSPGRVKFYHCGPTVYWTQHIGNLRGMTMGDLLVRSLRYFGFTVTHVRNYTDVGHLTSDADSGQDKMEKGALREGLKPSDIAQKYIDQFENDTKAINLVEPNFKPRATSFIQPMILLIEDLLKKGFAYETDLAVYFDISKFPDYPKLSHQKLAELVSGSGKAEISDPGKKNPVDFALWFFKTGAHENAMQFWPSPFHSQKVDNGYGVPGWHIECSAMCKAILGDTVDIHMGGVEHIPVHHTNEIAQSEAANGVKFVNYWLHNEHLVINNEKMAKSAGTGMSLGEIIKKNYDPLVLRYFFLQAQYRTRQNFTWEAMDAANQSLNQLLQLTYNAKKSSRDMLSEDKLAKIDEYRMRFKTALENDLNIPAALAVTWEVAKSNIPGEDKYDLINEFDQVLGLGLNRIPLKQSAEVTNIPSEINNLLKMREQFRSEKKFAEADKVRQEIEAKGYSLEDSAHGIKVIKNQVK
jgi:cysteinyl-tRNA synthetase